MYKVKQKKSKYRSFPLIVLAVLLQSVLSVLLLATGTVSAAGNPLAGASFYIDTVGNNAAIQAAAWRPTRPADAAMMDIIAIRPKAYWMGNWTPDSHAAAADYTSRAAAAGAVGAIVAYNIPFRDCGSYSAGGAASHDAYRAWIDGMAAGIGPRRTAVILEPDALPQLDCLDAAGRQARLDSLSYAVSKLKSNPATAVYLDAGNKGWISAANMAPRLQSANIGATDGFAVNVSNFYTNAESLSYGTDLSGRVGGKHFVVDTSRNGQGSLGGQWCNPTGRGLGSSPTSNTGNALADAYLWIKGPGESDGTCNGGPTAGAWWAEYALGLAQRANLGVAGGGTSTPASKSVKSGSGGSGGAAGGIAAQPGSVLSTNTTKASGNAKFAHTAYWFSQASRFPLLVTGVYTVPGIPAEAKNVLVAIDGREHMGTVIDSTYLPNGFHDLVVSYIDKSGASQVRNTRIYTENSLNGFEQARNVVLAVSAFPQTLPGALTTALVTLAVGAGLLLPRDLFPTNRKLRRQVSKLRRGNRIGDE